MVYVSYGKIGALSGQFEGRRPAHAFDATGAAPQSLMLSSARESGIQQTC